MKKPLAPRTVSVNTQYMPAPLGPAAAGLRWCEIPTKGKTIPTTRWTSRRGHSTASQQPEPVSSLYFSVFALQLPLWAMWPHGEVNKPAPPDPVAFTIHPRHRVGPRAHPPAPKDHMNYRIEIGTDDEERVVVSVQVLHEGEWTAIGTLSDPNLVTAWTRALRIVQDYAG